MLKRIKYEAYTKEIKNRFRYIAISFLCSFGISYYKSTELIYLFVSSCYTKNPLDPKISFIFTDVREAFSATLLICLAVSLFLCFSFVLYSFVCFLLPSWFLHERKENLSILYALSILFLCYTSWVHLIIIPKVCDFFFSFQVENIDCFSLTVEPRIYPFVMWCVWSLLLALFLFACVCSLSFFIFRGRVALSYWSKNRKPRVLSSILLAALVSPPELYTQALLSLTLFFSLEVVVFIALLFHTFVNKRSFKVKIV